MRFARQRFIDQFFVYGWPVAQVDAGRGLRVDAANQVLVQLFRYERHEWREQGDKRDQALIEREVRGHLVLVHASFPEAFATAPQVPVRQILQEFLDGCRRL